MNPYEMNKVIKKLRNGEKVLCHHCKKGYFESRGDYKTSPGFQCSYCNENKYQLGTTSQKMTGGIFIPIFKKGK